MGTCAFFTFPRYILYVWDAVSPPNFDQLKKTFLYSKSSSFFYRYAKNRKPSTIRFGVIMEKQVRGDLLDPPPGREGLNKKWHKTKPSRKSTFFTPMMNKQHWLPQKSLKQAILHYQMQCCKFVAYIIIATRNVMAKTDSKNESAPKNSPYTSKTYTKSAANNENSYLLQEWRHQMLLPLTYVLKGPYSSTSADSMDNTSCMQLAHHNDTITAIVGQSLDGDLQSRSTDTTKRVFVDVLKQQNELQSYMLTKIWDINFQAQQSISKHYFKHRNTANISYFGTGVFCGPLF